MPFEIEFHPVGEGSKAGDAITLRYGFPGRYKVMVIDGGTEESGQKIVEHICAIYGPNTVISDMVSTHPDGDHCSGLRTIIRELPVERLWIHGLWFHAKEMLGLFADHRWTEHGLAGAIRREYPIVDELINLAIERGVQIFEPFAGQSIGPFTVLSPSKINYQHLVPQFRKTPASDVNLLKARNIWIGEGYKGGLNGLLRGLADIAVNWIPETWSGERLMEGAITAAENESSTVLLGDFEGSRILLTADAGVNALSWACDNASVLGLDILQSELIQVPHHGSRSNVTPSILNRMVGPILAPNSPPLKNAIVSAPANDSKHPRKMVLNAFTRRGAQVSTTQGLGYRYHSNMPNRLNESSAKIVGFSNLVEGYD